jgi:hypothetical protein
MLGAIVGDTVGLVYEFNNYRSTSFTSSFILSALYNCADSD